jgi:hypothetical protein
MSGNHTLLEDFGSIVIQTLLEGKRRYLPLSYTYGYNEEDRHIEVLNHYVDSSNRKYAAAAVRPPRPPKFAVASSPPNDPPRGRAGGSSPPHPPSNIIKYLLGLGAAGAGGYALRDKLGDTADEAGEHINSLRDKLANMIATHHDEV